MFHESRHLNKRYSFIFIRIGIRRNLDNLPSKVPVFLETFQPVASRIRLSRLEIGRANKRDSYVPVCLNRFCKLIKIYSFTISVQTVCKEWSVQLRLTRFLLN